ncbi:MAG: hypothetical protein AAFZ15_14225 [Bacteroidota bacterium]
MNKLLLLTSVILIFSFTKTNHGEDPATGFFLDVKSHQLYGLFAKSVHSEDDRSFFNVTGNIADDDDVYTICEDAKRSNPYLKGNQLTLSNIENTISASGTFNICPEIKKIGFRVAGVAGIQLDGPMQRGSEISPSDLSMNWVAGFDLNLPKHLMKIMLTDFTVRPSDTSVVRYHQSPAYQAAWMEWSTREKKRAEAIADLQEGGQFDLSSEDTPNTLTLGHLNMKWDDELQSFITEEKKAVLVNMGKQDLHYFIDAKAEFYMPANKNDQLRLLLHSPNGHFYFFNYMNGMLQTCSSNSAYNDFLINIKEKDTEVEVVKGQPYELQFASAYVVKVFEERLGE